MEVSFNSCFGKVCPRNERNKNNHPCPFVQPGQTGVAGSELCRGHKEMHERRDDQKYQPCFPCPLLTKKQTGRNKDRNPTNEYVEPDGRQLYQKYEKAVPLGRKGDQKNHGLDQVRQS